MAFQINCVFEEMGIEVEPRSKPRKSSEWMRELGMTGSEEIGWGGKAKKKKSESLSLKVVVEVAKKWKTSSLKDLKKKELLGQSSGARL